MEENGVVDLINIHKITSAIDSLTEINHYYFLPIYYQIKLMGGRFRIKDDLFGFLRFFSLHVNCSRIMIKNAVDCKNLNKSKVLLDSSVKEKFIKHY